MKVLLFNCKYVLNNVIFDAVFRPKTFHVIKIVAFHTNGCFLTDGIKNGFQNIQMY